MNSLLPISTETPEWQKQEVDHAVSQLPHHRPIRRTSMGYTLSEPQTQNFSFTLSKLGHTVLRTLTCCGPFCLAKQYSCSFLLHPKLCLWDISVIRCQGTEAGFGFSRVSTSGVSVPYPQCPFSIHLSQTHLPYPTIHPRPGTLSPFRSAGFLSVQAPEGREWAAVGKLDHDGDGEWREEPWMFRMTFPHIRHKS